MERLKQRSTWLGICTILASLASLISGQTDPAAITAVGSAAVQAPDAAIAALLAGVGLISTNA